MNTPQHSENSVAEKPLRAKRNRRLVTANLEGGHLSIVEKPCEICRHVFRSVKRSKARFCSMMCAQGGHRNHNFTTGYSVSSKKKYQWLKKNHPLKKRAREIVKYAIQTGALIKLPCVKCGDLISHAHHEDYSKPLEVIFLCRKHHREHHKNTK